MTVTEEPHTNEIPLPLPRITEWQQTQADEHGDFLYTLRQYLLMRRLTQGGEWTDVVNHVSRELRENYMWDAEARDSYGNWHAWYHGARAE